MDINELIRDAVREELFAANQQTQEYGEEILDPQEALAFFGTSLSYSSLMRQAREGKIPCFHIGSKVFFRKSKLIEWIEQQEQRSLQGMK